MRTMWKKAGSFLCLLVAILAMPLLVTAEEIPEKEDSRTISQDILSCFDEETVDTVFRGYDIHYNYDLFSQYGDMDEALANLPAQQVKIYYFAKNKKGDTVCYTYDGSGLTDTGYTWGALWSEFLDEKADALIQMVDANIVVENIYYFRYGNWYAIYYKTNLGDYVYFTPEEAEYLMGLAQFTALGSELKDLVTKYKVLSDMVGCSPMSLASQLHVDLSPYDITSPDFDPNAPFVTLFKPGKFIAIGSAVLLVTLIVCRYLIRGHRKYREKKERMASRI